MLTNKASQCGKISTNAAKLRTERAPLYYRYPRQSNPQPAQLRIDPAAREAIAEVNCLQNCVTMAEWNNRVICLSIPDTLTGSEAADFLESDEVQGLLELICLGYSEHWNGSNVVGSLDAEAQDAKELLEALCERLEGSLIVWEAAEYISGTTIPAATSDEALKAMALSFVADAKSDGFEIDGDLLTACERRREYARDREL